MGSPENTIDQICKMADEANLGGMYLKAAKLYRRAGRLAGERRDERKRVSCLFWEGVCFRMAGKYEEALPLLMEAAASQSPETNPADVYNAATTAIDISLTQKPAAIPRKLIRQTRAWLKTHRKEDWRHILDLLAGELEYRRGEFDAARSFFTDAYDTWKGEYPCYVEAEHLKCLCNTAFAQRDEPGLERWTRALESCSKQSEGEKVKAREARLLLFRARRSGAPDFSPAADLALSTLDHREMFDGTTGAHCVHALRVLILARRRLDVDRIKARYAMEKDDDFDCRLFLGDEGLCRAREALGMAVRDDVYDLEFPDPAPPFPDASSGLKHIDAAAGIYEKAMPIAEKEDTRLETGYYTRTLRDRLQRAERMRNCLKPHARRETKP